MPSRDGPSRTSSPTVLYDEPNSYLRPFRDSQSRPFTSALDSTLSHTSTSRRRRVSEGQLSPVQGDLTRSAHSRSRTVDDHDGHHPLCAASSRSMSASTSGHTSHHDTRPHLARLLSLWEKDSSPANHDKLEGAHAGSSSGLGRGAEERVVLVHEVCHPHLRTVCGNPPSLANLVRPTFPSDYAQRLPGWSSLEVRHYCC